MKNLKLYISIVAVSACLICSGWIAFAQLATQQRGSGIDEVALGKPYRGISAGNKIEPNLFKLKSTGVSTAPVIQAAEAFIAGLSENQRKATLYPVDDIEWRKWDNRHFPKREGTSFKEMNETQRELAFALLRESLSAKGLKLSQDIMKLNGTLAELANNFEEYGEWLYWITIMGKPSSTEPWGWQLDGHHLIINYFVLGDQVVMSPVFLGSEPVRATSGKFQGTTVLQSEQNKGLQLAQSLNEDQRKVAILAVSKDGNNALAQAYKDNIDLDYAGIPGSRLNDNQKKMLLDVIEEFVGNMRDGHSRVKMEEVRTHLDRTYFAWIGSTAENSVFYYRVHSPVVLIEFDHQGRVAPVRSPQPTRDHIHAVLRTPNGNDYGKDLLRQHYEKHHK